MSKETKHANPQPLEAVNEGEIPAPASVAPASPGEHVEIHRGGPQTVKGEHIEIHQGGAQYIEGRTVTMDRSGALALRAEQVTMSMSGAGVLSVNTRLSRKTARPGSL